MQDLDPSREPDFLVRGLSALLLPCCGISPWTRVVVDMEVFIGR